MQIPFRSLFLLLLFGSGCCINAQPIFEKNYNYGHFDRCHKVIENEKGEILMLGSSTPDRSLDRDDFLLIKTNKFGDAVWTRSYGGAMREESADMVRTSDGGFLLIGYTLSFGSGKEDIYLVKTDRDGNQLWQETFGGSGNDGGTAIIENRTGGYVFTGSIETVTGYKDLVVAAIDEAGNLLWQQTIGGKDYDLGFDLIQTYDGGFLIGGVTRSTGKGEDDVYLVKTDIQGNLQWTRTYGGPESDGAFALQQTHAGEYIVAGYTRSLNPGNYGIYLLKINNSGDSIWTRFFHGKAFDALIHDDGAILTAGTKNSYDPSIGLIREPYLLKISPEGDSIWSASFAGTDDRSGYGICRSHDGTYLLTGRRTGKYDGQSFPSDGLLLRAQVPTDQRMKNRLRTGLFPNPNRGSFQINSSAPLKRIEISDARGRIVYTKEQSPLNLQPSTTIDLPDFRPGIYYAMIFTSAGFQSKAFVLY